MIVARVPSDRRRRVVLIQSERREDTAGRFSERSRFPQYFTRERCSGERVLWPSWKPHQWWVKSSLECCVPRIGCRIEYGLGIGSKGHDDSATASACQFGPVSACLERELYDFI